MDLITITCERDIQDLLLQAHSIDKFVMSPCCHWITVEDESLTPDEWHNLLAPYYTRHTLKLNFSKRPNLQFDEPFNLGYRRQQVLKIETAARIYAETSLILDSKNFFIRPVELDSWPYKNGVGRYTILSLEPEVFLPRQWVQYIHQKTGIPIPEKFPPRLATPFAVTTKYMFEAATHPSFHTLFYNRDDVCPMTEMFYYYFFVPEDELDIQTDHISGAENYYNIPDIKKCDEYFEKITLECVIKNSPSHGLHRKVRRYMPESAKNIYSDWLKSIDLDAELVDNYVNFVSIDATWGL